MTQNEHVYEICCRSEVTGDVNSGENVKNTEDYGVLKFEVVSFCGYQDIIIMIIRKATKLHDGGGRGGHWR